MFHVSLLLSFLQLVVSATVLVFHLVSYLTAVYGHGAPESSECGVSTIVPKTCIGSFPFILGSREDTAAIVEQAVSKQTGVRRTELQSLVVLW